MTLLANLKFTNRVATEDEIRKSLESLKKQRETMPHYSVFNDNNWAETDAEIAELEWVLE